MSNVTITPKELQAWLDRWDLRPADGAKVLGVKKPRMTEWLKPTGKVPPYIQKHIETFDRLAETKARKIIMERLE